MVSASGEVARREDDTGTGTLVKYGLSRGGVGQATGNGGYVAAASSVLMLFVVVLRHGAAVGRRGRAQPRLHTIIQTFHPFRLQLASQESLPLGGVSEGCQASHGDASG